jgi:hypothetical protein
MALRCRHSVPEKESGGQARSHISTMELLRAYFNSTWMTSNGFLLVFSGK